MKLTLTKPISSVGQSGLFVDKILVICRIENFPKLSMDLFSRFLTKILETVWTAKGIPQAQAKKLDTQS